MAGDAHGDKTQEEPQAQEDLGQQQAAQEKPQVSGTDWENAVDERDEKIAAPEAQVAEAAKNTEAAKKLRGELRLGVQRGRVGGNLAGEPPQIGDALGNLVLSEFHLNGGPAPADQIEDNVDLETVSVPVIAQRARATSRQQGGEHA